MGRFIDISAILAAKIQKDFETSTILQKILHLCTTNPENHCLWIPYREWLKTA